MNISESMNSGNVKIQFDEYNIEIYPFKLKYKIILEEEGYTPDQIQTNLTDKPALWGTKIGWLLMTDESKEKFENSIDIFRDSLVMADLGTLIGGLLNCMNRSYVEPTKTDVNEENPKKKIRKKKKSGKK